MQSTRSSDPEPRHKEHSETERFTITRPTHKSQSRRRHLPQKKHERVDPSQCANRLYRHSDGSTFFCPPPKMIRMRNVARRHRRRFQASSTRLLALPSYFFCCGRLHAISFAFANFHHVRQSLTEAEGFFVCSRVENRNV